MWMKENRTVMTGANSSGDLTAEVWGSRSHRCKHGGGKLHAGMRQSCRDRCGVSLWARFCYFREPGPIFAGHQCAA